MQNRDDNILSILHGGVLKACGGNGFIALVNGKRGKKNSNFAFLKSLNVRFGCLFFSLKDIGKNKLIELVTATKKRNEETSSETSILITGLSVNPMASNLREYGIYANEHPFGKYILWLNFFTIVFLRNVFICKNAFCSFLDANFKANNFMRFNERDATSQYKNAINSSNFVLATVDQIHKLKE